MISKERSGAGNHLDLFFGFQMMITQLTIVIQSLNLYSLTRLEMRILIMS
jgi:hypothetical protein